jgi:vacuolar protein sorting-associated protein 45
MDVVAAVSGYIARMVSVGDSSTPGNSSNKMKILLLDSETVGKALWFLSWQLLIVL